ncbi:hypothetical protein COV05_03240 [Candidatus Uhrbacteria bacterium CG10_big_fil_rev_8_21_14_0_10_48_16]|uniref:Uncharacterized protein n=1 Tax=Candidatus Uhrbacteria bacterium CG10_big_fil_rev_8_21_14_0_10_48_16 TaxID=1975038 RepID=A0A2M8LGU6_9BACT|nr:MAG: hypothetical protein COV05_03240 [Candidatus Uhrbacteria bacterium CG10_big_fil_rev_8_21_14_0_10_48_16]
MFRRLPHLLMFSIIFGSIWIQGMVPDVHGDHGMMDQNCLEHCLSSFHLGTVDDGIVVSIAYLAVESSVREERYRIQDEVTQERDFASHHDPGRILTTIKRE